MTCAVCALPINGPHKWPIRAPKLRMHRDCFPTLAQVSGWGLRLR